MMNVDRHFASGPPEASDDVSGGSGRFNVLLTEDRPRPDEYWSRQLPRLLEPQGVVTHLASTGRQALDLAENLPIHAAVIDMGTPMGEDSSKGADAFSGEPAGAWLMQLFQRLPNRPPVVIVHSRTYSQREADRVLRDALRLGAFSVLNKPIELEQLLRVFRRLLDRQYHGFWPEG